MPKNNKYSIYGYFGFKNVGDDIMLFNALEYLNIHFKGDKFYIFVKEDYYTNDSNFHSFGNINLCFIKITPIINNVFIYFYALSVKSAFWIGGTCLYETDTSGIQGIKWIFSLIEKYAAFGKKFSFCNIGIGDFTTKNGENLYHNIIKRSGAISCRDQASLHKLKNTFGNKDKFLLGGDLASLLKPTHKSKTEQNILIFCGHYQYAEDDKIISTYSKILNYLGDIGFYIMFLPMHQGENSDNLFHWKISKKLKCENSVVSYDSADVFEYLGSAKFIISMRLHGIFLADIFGVPNIGIAYHEKVSIYVENTRTMVDIRNKKIGEDITSKEVLSVIKTYKRPHTFLAMEKERATNGMSIFYNII